MIDDKGYPQNVTSEGLNYFQPQQTENALKIRLETEDTLEKIEMYLKGESWAYNQKNELVKVDDSDAKANGKGVRAIMSALHSYINKSVVQGNLTEAQVNMVMQDFHRGMANLLGFHCDEWAINRSERRNIVDFIEPFVFMFVSRTKNNEERKSFGMSVVERGRETFSQANKKFGLFK